MDTLLDIPEDYGCEQNMETTDTGSDHDPNLFDIQSVGSDRTSGETVPVHLRNRQRQPTTPWWKENQALI